MEPELTVSEWLDKTVRITSDAVYFGDTKLPGVIAEGGVTLKPGMSTDVNALTITFLVGEVHAADDLYRSEVTTPASTVTQYRSRTPRGAELIQDVPETSTTERMHDLSIECWCDPTVDGEYLRHRKVQA